MCSSESTLVKMPHCWKANVAAHMRPSCGQWIVVRLHGYQGGSHCGQFVGGFILLLKSTFNVQNTLRRP